MTFTEAAKKNPLPQPIILLEIARDEVQSMFSYLEPGIVEITLRSDRSVDFDFWGADDYNTAYVNISSLSVTPESGDSVETYTEVSSLANLRSQNKSWLFNAGEQTLYVHFDLYTPWWQFYSVEIGYSQGWSNTGYHSGTVWYPSAIASDIKISERMDSEFYGTDRYDPIDINLLNDGSLDSLPQSDLYGKKASILLGFEDLDNGYDDFEILKTGYVEYIPLVAQDKVTSTINDSRKFLSRSLPINRVDQATYTDLSDDDNNRVKPLAFGDIRGAVPICLNSQEAGPPANYTLLIADTDAWNLNSTTPVCYVNGSAVTVSNYSAANGTFTVASADYTPDEDDIWVDFTGYDDSGVIEKGTDIIKNLLAEFAAISYISDNYDTTQWAAATLSAYDIALFVDESKSLADICMEVAQSCLGLFKQTRAGKWTFLFEDDSAAVVDTIYQRDILNIPQARYDAGQYISSGTCKYSPHLASGKGYRVENTSYEAAAYARLKKYKAKEFETIISDATDAADYLDKQLAKNSTIYPVFRITTSLQFIAVQLLDNVNVEINRVDRKWYGTIKCQVIEIDINPAAGLMAFELRYIEDA